MQLYWDTYEISRLFLQRGIAGVYIMAFANALNQGRALIGERGLLPIPDFLASVNFKQVPSIFHWKYTDSFFSGISWLGIAISTALFLGFLDSASWWVVLSIWLLLYIIYLSIVNVGQIFYAFGWESMLLEAGFFVAFLGPANMQLSIIPIFLLRWMLFRTELGAGLIKIRHDPCWKKLTCLYYHHESQPMPNPLSWYAHHLPKPMHRAGVAFSHFVQIICPFFLFAPQPFAVIAAVFIIVHQCLLAVSGNYSWLNLLTIILGFSAIGDSFFSFHVGSITHTQPFLFIMMLYILLAGSFFLSIKPTRNLFSKYQLMNYNYNPLHLVGSYGAFGTVTKERYEMVIQATHDKTISSATRWEEYEFKGKPGDIFCRPPQIAPYHLRLDWLMWFVPFTFSVIDGRIISLGYELWFLRFIRKLLEHDKNILKLLKRWPQEQPSFIRVVIYQYHFSNVEEKKRTGALWKRTYIGVYMSSQNLRMYH